MVDSHERHTHGWTRLFKRPDDRDVGARLTYTLAGWERIFVCTVCDLVSKKAYQTGRMHPLLMQDDLRKRAQEWNAEIDAKKRGDRPMSAVRLTIAVPTIGRPTLARTLRSIVDAGFGEDDELLVIGDGPQPEARRTVEFYGRHLKATYLETEPTNFVGHPQRNHAMARAKGTHFMTIDDDDAYTFGALARVKETVAKNPARIHIFKMRGSAPRHSYGHCWRSKDLVVGNVGSPMICVPNVPEKLGRWASQYCGDFEFYASTIKLQDDGIASVIWVDDVIADIY